MQSGSTADAVLVLLTRCCPGVRKSLEYEGLTTDQWFFPFTLNSPALIVNTPWVYRAMMKVRGPI